MPQQTFTTKITIIRDVAPEVREITLAATEPPLEYQPGQWLSLQLPIGDRPPLVRAYSLAAPRAQSGEMVLCLDRVPGGLGSEYLFGLEPGAEVTVAGPLGNFVLPEGDSELLWLARYTGIVPFRAMLLHLAVQSSSRRVTLLYSAPPTEDLAYREELEKAAAELPWFELVMLTGEVDRILTQLPEWVGERRDLVPMVCGKREFVRPIRDFFYGLGFDRKAVKWENYD